MIYNQRTTQTEREEYEKKLVVYSEKIRKFSSNISLSTETFDAENIDIFSSKVNCIHYIIIKFTSL